MKLTQPPPTFSFDVTNFTVVFFEVIPKHFPQVVPWGILYSHKLGILQDVTYNPRTVKNSLSIKLGFLNLIVISISSKQALNLHQPL